MPRSRETLSALTDLMAFRQGARDRIVDLPRFGDPLEAQWVAERRALARFRVEEPPYSSSSAAASNRGGLPSLPALRDGVMVRAPGQGHAHRRYRKGQPLPDSLRVKVMRKQMSDEHRLDAVEQLVGVARESGHAADASGDGFHDRSPRRDLGDSRPANDGTAGRPARWR